MTLAISILLLTGIGAGLEGGMDEYIDPEDLEEDMDRNELLRFENCYEAGNEIHCYQMESVSDLLVEFKEDLNCSLREEYLEEYEKSSNCYSTVEIKEEKSINITVRRIRSPEDYEIERREEKLEEGEEITAIISPQEINYTKCEEPEISETLFGIVDIYEFQCSYEGEEYITESSYARDGIVIHEISEPEEPPFLPLWVMIVIAVIVIGAVSWFLYPKIKEKMEK